MMLDTLRQGKYLSIFWHTDAPIHDKTTCCHVALNQLGQEMICVAYVGVSALFRAVHTPARFATIELNFGVVLAHHGFSAHWTCAVLTG